jgi:hypothetical protein
MLQRHVVSAASVSAQGFVRLSPQSLCSFTGHLERQAARPLKSLRFYEARFAFMTRFSPRMRRKSLGGTTLLVNLRSD